jgi:signal transduction histidine kinase/DNA-binding NarL/FixJ family response regulator
MEATGDGHWDWNIPVDKVYVSPLLLDICGLPADSTFASRSEWVDRFPFYPGERPRYEQAVAEHFAGKTARLDEEIRIIPRGETRWVHMTGRCSRDASGTPIRWAGSVTDVTDRHLAEEELQRMEHQLRQAQRLEAMGTLAGGIAHDFNNLLGAILGYGEMALRDAPPGSRLRRDLDSIMIAGERGRALVDRILAFSRSGVGERVAVHVEEVVRETLGLFAAKSPEGIAIEERLRAGHAAVMGDATQIHQVLMNLVTNAVQAMPSGGTLRVSLDRASVELPRVVTTGAVAATDYVVLEVADTGSGIPPEIVESIFDPFFTTKEVGVGTGLGLSLVHGIVTGLGGAIDVATTVGKGSVFTVYLPRAGDITSVTKSRKRAQPKTRRGDRERVLVVDDEESLVRLATRTLTELGYAPVGFTASAAALDAFLADQNQFDAVITDESMPGLSGSELIRRVRRIRPTIPILLVSGYLSPEVVERAREAGADEVLKKPLSARQLATSLDRLLQAAKARPEDVGVSALPGSVPKGRRRTAATRSAARPTRRR